MFWKRKQTDTEIFSYELNDRRSSYRVSPSADAPIIVEVNGEKVRVINISAGGLAFKSKTCNTGDLLSIEFLLPDLDVSIAARLNVKKIDKQNVCHCQFKAIGEDEVEAIHQYVLRRQKELIQSQKANMKNSVKANPLPG